MLAHKYISSKGFCILCRALKCPPTKAFLALTPSGRFTVNTLYKPYFCFKLCLLNSLNTIIYTHFKYNYLHLLLNCAFNTNTVDIHCFIIELWEIMVRICFLNEITVFKTLPMFQIKPCNNKTYTFTQTFFMC